MKKVINYCGNCPFLFENMCILNKNLKKNDYIVTIIDENNPPEWCPILTDDFYLSFKNFTFDRLSEIKNKKIEIAESDDKIELQKQLDVLLECEEHQLENFNSSIDDINAQLDSLKDVSEQLDKVVGNLKNL